MNLNEFEDELNKSDEAAPSPLESSSDLNQIRYHLSSLKSQDLTSDERQRWAWTRFSASMKARKKKSHFFLNWSLAGAATVLLLTGTVAFNNSDNSQQESTGNQVVTLTVHAQPEVTESEPEIHAVPFYSEDAEADVIWATGYDYLPSTYELE
ncbi:MAG: hypothetical protein AAGA18_08895 [Verrucomicrobiota bacterium]